MTQDVYLELLRHVPHTERRDRRILALLAAGLSQREVVRLRRAAIQARGDGRLVVARRQGCCTTVRVLSAVLSDVLDASLEGLAPEDEVAGISQPAVSRLVRRWRDELRGVEA